MHQELIMFRCTSKFAYENELVIDPNSDTEEQDGQEGGDNDQCWFYMVLGAVKIAVGLFQRAHKDELNNIIE
jgi:hypothetical protein